MEFYFLKTTEESSFFSDGETANKAFSDQLQIRTNRLSGHTVPT